MATIAWASLAFRVNDIDPDRITVSAGSKDVSVVMWDNGASDLRIVGDDTDQIRRALHRLLDALDNHDRFHADVAAAAEVET